MAVAYAVSAEFGQRIMQARGGEMMKNLTDVQSLLSPGEKKLINEQQFNFPGPTTQRYTFTRTSYSSNQLTVTKGNNAPTRVSRSQHSMALASRLGPVEAMSRRAWANAYELSQDLQERQVERLENKYSGGTMSARRAATTIQQAYRQYRMAQNFSRLRNEQEERRLIKRMEFHRSRTVCSDMSTAVTALSLPDDFLNDDYINTDSLTMRLFSAEAEHYVSCDAMSHSHSADSMLQHFSSTAKSTQRISARKSSFNTITDRHSQSEMFQQSTVQSFRQMTFQKNIPINRNVINEECESLVSEPLDNVIKSFTSGSPVNNMSMQKSNLISIPVVKSDISSTSDSDQKRTGMVNASGLSNRLPDYDADGKISLQRLDDILNELNDCSDLISQTVESAPKRPVESISNRSVEPVSSKLTEPVSSRPVEPIDLPSENFEHLLENNCSQESLDDSFHSDDSVSPVNENPPPNFSHIKQVSVSQTKQSDSPSHFTSMHHSSVQNNSALKPADRTIELDKLGSPVDYSTIEVKMRKKKTGNEEAGLKKSPRTSPIWKRKSQSIQLDDVLGGKMAENVERSSTRGPLGKVEGASGAGVGSSFREGGSRVRRVGSGRVGGDKMGEMSDKQRKRMYRVGLNLFNKKPESGVKYLIGNGFVDDRADAVARFLLSRKGLSKQMIGEYLGNLQSPFNMEVLGCFAEQIDLTGLQIDTALRKFQSYYRMPGEAQKIERLMEAFASRYWECNPEVVARFHRSDSVFLLAFAIIMLNTDLHNSSIKPDRKMKLEDFIKNLRGIDDGHDIDAALLTGIYQRIKQTEFKAGADHVGHVMKVEQMIVGKKPLLSLPHRRLVCYCRLYEVVDPTRKEKLGQHQREVFLFNDILMITKLLSKKKTVSYTFRQSMSLYGMTVFLFETQNYKFGIRLVTGDKLLILLNARSADDQKRFVDDLQESIQEVSDMESLRIEEELRKQQYLQNSVNLNRYSKDSGVVDVEMLKLADQNLHRLSAPECSRPKKSALSNSLIELREGSRRASGASLDSGVQASTESGSTGSCQDSGFSVLPSVPPRLRH